MPIASKVYLPCCGLQACLNIRQKVISPLCVCEVSYIVDLTVLRKTAVFFRKEGILARAVRDSTANNIGEKEISNSAC